MDSTTNPTQDYNISQLVRTDIRERLPEPVVKQILTTPPFLNIHGTFNFRDISNTATAPNVRKGFVYRSGNLTKISGIGMANMVIDAGVKTIFDLRNPSEREKSPSPEIPGADTVWLPYAVTPQKIDLTDFAKDDDGVSGFLKIYDDVLRVLQPTFKAVFTHIRDCPEKPFLFHCTAGKDRTGVLAALILQLVGVPSDSISHDYLLTRIGAEPARDALSGAFQAGLKDERSDPSANLGKLRLMGVDEKTMPAFINVIESRFKDGVVGYLKSDHGFIEEDIEKMRVNLAPLASEFENVV